MVRIADHIVALRGKYSALAAGGRESSSSMGRIAAEITALQEKQVALLAQQQN
jgi:hypothetical protein